MPAWHAARAGRDGVTLVDIGVGPSNAKTITDHVAVLQQDVMLMIGHCGGLRNHQDIGDLVLATTYHRADGVLDHVLPTSVPVASNHRLNSYLLDALVRRDLPYRLGTVYTTANRNWEFEQESVLADMRLYRAVAVDMESATVATNSLRLPVPATCSRSATSRCTGGRSCPWRRRTSTPPRSAGTSRSRSRWSSRYGRPTPDQALPAADVRSADEPLLGMTQADRTGVRAPGVLGQLAAQVAAAGAGLTALSGGSTAAGKSEPTDVAVELHRDSTGR